MHDYMLVRMVNQIADFYATGADEEAAAKETLSHLTRMWAHRMRLQMAEIGPSHADLGPVARRAVELLVTAEAARTAVAG